MAINLLTEVYCNDILETVQLLHSKEKIYEKAISDIDFIRTVAVARITMPGSYVRLSAGRESMSDTMQALCFLAGANSIFYGDKLLTTSNPGKDKDELLFENLGIMPV